MRRGDTMIGYPTKKKAASAVHSGANTLLSTKHRLGMGFEDDINLSNEYYRQINKAIIYKKPTPIQVVRVDYPMRSKAKIVEAYYKTPSTTDYNGIYRGKYIDFEAKQVSLKTMFPLKDIHHHQIEHLRQVVLHGGIGFILLRFVYYDETYLIDAGRMIAQYDDPATKSLPYPWVQTEGYLVAKGYQPRLDYLKIVDTLYFKEVTHDKETENK